MKFRPANYAAVALVLLATFGIGLLTGRWTAPTAPPVVVTASPRTAPSLEYANAHCGVPVVMQSIMPEERRRRVALGGQTIWQVADERIIECNYIDGKPRSWSRQHKIDGEWKDHGTRVFWRQDGSYDIEQRVRDEILGPVNHYNAAGKLVRTD